MIGDQPELIPPEALPSRLRWEKLFSFIPSFPDKVSAGPGRKAVNRSAILNALIYQRLSRKRFLRDLHNQLLESPSLTAAVGFDPYQGPPSLQRFSAFLNETPNEDLQVLRIGLVRELISLGVIQGADVAMDSCPVASWVRENNLKTDLRHRRWDKNRIPKGDPDARLGVRIHFPNPDERRIDYFWGYRNHTIADVDSELPMWERTEPNNVGEVTLAIDLLQATQNCFDLNIKAVLGDAEYDTEKILCYIMDTLHAEAFIPHNPRRSEDKNGFIRQGNIITCPANLTMNRKGHMTVKGITYLQYRCPFYYGRKPDLLMCPINHPKFINGKGCNYLWRLTDNPRDRIAYTSASFKETYAKRTAVERVFSRLLAITMEEPAVRGLDSIRNHCTISHIATLVVALTANRTGRHDFTRFVRTFIPRFLGV